jgi:hypothetical protein
VAITNGYASLSNVKAALRITDAVDDALIELSIEAASREIDGHCQRTFINSGTATRYYVPDDALTVRIDDLISLTTLQTSPDGILYDDTWLATDYQLEPVNSLAGGIFQPFTQIRAVGTLLFPYFNPANLQSGEATVKVTGVWGWPSIPVQIKQATILLAMRQFKRYDSPLGIAGFGDLGGIRVGRTDPDVEALIMPFKKVSIA